jgi:glutaconyl-CoA decarboxylase
MKKYNIIVNGTAYAVEVEEVGGSAAAPAAAPAPAPALAPAAPAAAAPAAAKAEAPAPAPAAPSAAPSAGAKTVECPMPGTILDIKVKPGDAVTAGQVLLILEAMKMENEILAPKAETVNQIVSSKGSSVNAGDVLLTIG